MRCQGTGLALKAAEASGFCLILDKDIDSAYLLTRHVNA